MTTTEPRYSPLDLLRGTWLFVEDRPGMTLFRLAPSHRRARIAGVIVLVALYWSLRERLPPELGSWEFLFVLAAIWLLLGKWNRGPVILAVVENDEVAMGQMPHIVPRETIWTRQVRELEVRENLWKERRIVPLCQIYLHRKDAPPILIYQHWRTRRKHVLDLAARLAERWEARLSVDDSP